MVKTYDRWGPTQAFGIICSAASNSIFDGIYSYVPALEDVLVWDVKKGQLISMWHETGHRAEVTFILQSPTKDIFAVGYVDGSIKLWSASLNTVIVTLNGHKRAISTIAFDSSGSRLASGSQDTDVILWDVVAETGMYRLRGHRDQITSSVFIEKAPNDLNSSSLKTSNLSGYLITCSKDTFLKVWDLNTQHCVQTVVAHRSEVWSMDVDPDQRLLFTGSGDGEVRVWRIDMSTEGSVSIESMKLIHQMDVLPVLSRHRVSQIMFHPFAPFLAIQSHDRSVEIFRIRTEDEVKKKKTRRLKRVREKQEKASHSNVDKGKNPAEDEMELDSRLSATQTELVDLFTPYLVVRASGKIRSFDFPLNPNHTKSIQLHLALSNNALEVFTIPLPTKSKDIPEAARLHVLDIPGHRTDVRTISLSADEQLLATGSNGALKIWNVKTMACIRTLECGHAISSAFLPGDRHIVVGTKTGELLMYDIAAASLLETIKSHTSTVWSMDVRPDFLCLVTGSADKDVKFWDIKSKATSRPAGTSMALSHAKTLKMTDEVLATKYSPNNQLLAVALLDATVKVFYQDTLKFFLSLYGHKLPVLSLDISSDSKLIVTSSADKNVKIWGLDFGDCHKSIFAHDDSIMQVAFEPRSHNFFSASKDGYLKMWDGDKFQLIQKLDGHQGEIWALSVSRSGRFVVTGSHDKSIRIWENTDEPLFLEEERERELEMLYEGDIASNLNKESTAIGSGIDGADKDGLNGPEITSVQKHTTESLMAGEKIMEALELAEQELENARSYEESLKMMPEGEKSRVLPPKTNPLLVASGLTPDVYVLSVIETISSAALYDALLVLPFSKVVTLFRYMEIWARQGATPNLISQILTYILRTHAAQITATTSLRPILLSLRRHHRRLLLLQKAQIGYNLTALKYIQRQDEAMRTAELYEQGERKGWTEDEITTVKEKLEVSSNKKRKRIDIKS